MALADIPGYGAYIQRRQMNENAPLAELQRVSGVQGLLAKMQEQEQAKRATARAQQYEAELEALGPDATPEQRIAVASKYATPDKLMTVQQQSLDRTATNEATRAQREATLTQQAQAAQMMHEYRLRTATNDEQRAAETARHNAEVERNQRELAALRREAAAQVKPPTAPKGYRFKADNSGELEAIPGGPEDKAPKELARAKGAIQKADTVIGAVDEALTQTGPFTTGAAGAAFGMIPGTTAYDLDGTLDTIKANLGFAELQAMRDSSPTGGALGQVAVQELNMLQSTLASLKRGLGRQKLEAGLKKVRQHMQNWKRAVAESNPAVGQAAPAPAAPGATPAPVAAPPPLSPQEQAELDALRKKHGRR